MGNYQVTTMTNVVKPIIQSCQSLSTVNTSLLPWDLIVAWICLLHVIPSVLLASDFEYSMGRSVKYKSPSTLLRNQRRRSNFLRMKLSAICQQTKLTIPNLTGQPVEKPKQKVSETHSQPSKPMTLEDLKKNMSSASKDMEEERKNELAKDIEKRKKERTEDLEKLKVMLGLPP